MSRPGFVEAHGGWSDEQRAAARQVVERVDVERLEWVRIGFVGKHRKTDANGRARIKKRFAKAGVRVAKARAPGCDLVRKRIRIKRAR